MAATTTTSVDTTAVVSVENLALLSDRGRQAVENLVQHDAADGAQQHVYGNWPPPGTDDEGKKRLAEQVSELLRVTVSAFCFLLFDGC